MIKNIDIKRIFDKIQQHISEQKINYNRKVGPT